MEKKQKSKKSILIACILLPLLILGLYDKYKDIKAEKHSEYLASLSDEERLVYCIKEYEKDYSFYRDCTKELGWLTVGDYPIYLVDEYTEEKNKTHIGEWSYNEYFSNEELEKIKGVYSDSLESKHQDLIDGNYSSELLELHIGDLLSIKKELLNSNLEKRLYTEDILAAFQKVEEKRRVEAEEWEKERFEKEVYQYMKDAYNQITNFGDNYVPEIHDPQVAELASKQFGISTSEAGSIYVKMEMNSY